MSSSHSCGGGISLGTVVAAVISYVQWKSVGWAILHGLCGWIYVFFWAIGVADSVPF